VGTFTSRSSCQALPHFTQEVNDEKDLCPIVVCFSKLMGLTIHVMNAQSNYQRVASDLTELIVP
jgi:hypothetical protein